MKYLNFTITKTVFNIANQNFAGIQRNKRYETYLVTNEIIHLPPEHMGLVATKPVFRVSNKVRFKPACSATETSYKIEISLVASYDMVHSKKRITKALIRLHGCAGWSALLLFANSGRQVFLCRGPYKMRF